MIDGSSQRSLFHHESSVRFRFRFHLQFFLGLSFRLKIDWATRVAGSGVFSRWYMYSVCVIYPSLRSAGPPKSANNSFWFRGGALRILRLPSRFHSFPFAPFFRPFNTRFFTLDGCQRRMRYTHTIHTIHGPQVPSAKQNRVEIKQIKRLNVTLIYEWFNAWMSTLNATHDCASWSIAQVRVFSNSPKQRSNRSCWIAKFPHFIDCLELEL